MDKYLEPTKDEIIMAFVASCIESVADRLNVGYRDIFERMEKVGRIQKKHPMQGCFFFSQ